MEIKFTHFTGKELIFPNKNRNFLVGLNGSGKTLMLHQLMDYCDDNGLTYAHYDAMEAIYQAPEEINTIATDAELRQCVKIMQKLTVDFNEDIFNWAKYLNGGTTDQIGPMLDSPELHRLVLNRIGTGYTRLFMMILTGIRAKDADYLLLDLPETSLHISLCDVLIRFLMNACLNPKFVIATHSPSIIKEYEADEVVYMTQFFED